MYKKIYLKEIWIPKFRNVNFSLLEQVGATHPTIDEPSPNETYNNFVLSHEEAAKDNIPLKPISKKHIPWEINNILTI